MLPFTLLIVSGSLFFPYITAKNFFFRMIVELMGAAWVGLVLIDSKKYLPRRTIVLIAFTALLLIAFISSIFGVNFGSSFWSNFERMEGLITYLHLFLLFLILAGTFRTRREWFWMFGFSLGVSFLLAFYGLLEYIGAVNTYADSKRVISTLGNPLYVAAYLTFHIFLIAYVWNYARSRPVRWLLAGLFFFELLIFFLTGSRGAFLGIIGGTGFVVFLWIIFGASKKQKFIFGLALLFLLAVPFLFQALGDISFIKNNTVLSRFSDISLSDSTVRARFNIWGMAFKAFSERPLLGWGVGNFIIPFTKYYDVRMFGNEPWFDRTHNMPLEWLVATGIVGFLIYLFVFVAIVVGLVMAKKKGILQNRDVIIFTGMLVAYVFQLLFVFDVLATYFMLVLVLAFASVAASSSLDEWLKGLKNNYSSHALSFSPMKMVGAAGVFVLAFVFIYIFNVKPYYAAVKLIDGFRAVQEGKNAEALEGFESSIAFAKGTVGVPEIREHTARIALGVQSNPQLMANPAINALYQFAVKEMEDQAKNNSEKYPNIRYNIILGRLYSILGIITSNQTLITKAGEEYERAFEFAPTYFPLYQLYGEFLLQTGNFDAAIELMTKGEKLLADVGKKDVDILYSKPLIYVAAGNFDAAITSLQHAQLILGGGFERGKTKNFISVARSRFGTKSLPFVEKIAELDPQDSFAALTLAEMYAEVGSFEKARTSAIRARTIDPSLAGEVEEFLKSIQ